MTEALARHERGEARVIPIILRDCQWHSAPFGKIQALPENGKPVRKWRDLDSAWRKLADGLEKVIRELLERKNMRNVKHLSQSFPIASMY